jgi:hypothetical protein
MVRKAPVRRMAGPLLPDFGWVFVIRQPPRFDWINYQAIRILDTI